MLTHVGNIFSKLMIWKYDKHALCQHSKKYWPVRFWIIQTKSYYYWQYNVLVTFLYSAKVIIFFTMLAFNAKGCCKIQIGITRSMFVKLILLLNTETKSNIISLEGCYTFKNSHQYRSKWKNLSWIQKYCKLFIKICIVFGTTCPSWTFPIFILNYQNNQLHNFTIIIANRWLGDNEGFTTWAIIRALVEQHWHASCKRNVDQEPVIGPVCLLSTIYSDNKPIAHQVSPGLPYTITPKHGQVRLTYWGLNIMACIWQAIFSNEFHRKSIWCFWILSLLLKVQMAVR